MKNLNRAEAISIIAHLEPSKLSPSERKETLEIALLEPLEEYNNWPNLPSELKTEFEGETLLYSPDDNRYNAIISLLKFDELQSYRNEYLEELLLEAGQPAKIVDGLPELLFSCPCCGYRTLTEQASWDICNICWWEDDGQDNDKADQVFGGPNGSLSLTQARINFIKHGIFDPDRDDLVKIKHHPRMYLRGRRFTLQEDGKTIDEQFPESDL